MPASYNRVSSHESLYDRESSPESLYDRDEIATYGTLDVGDRLGLIPLALAAPFITIKTVLETPFSVHRRKGWKRRVEIAAVRFMMRWSSIRQLQWFQTPSIETYKMWCHNQRVEPAVDALRDGSHLMWIGRRRYDRVVLYFHGGGFLVPLTVQAVVFIRAMQIHLNKTTPGVGVAILAYSPAPFETFPTQLEQANSALAHLFANGLSSQNLQIIGDSAGGNLALQVFSHALHPEILPTIAPSPLASTAPLGGVFLLSPWVNPQATGSDAGSFHENRKKDIVAPATYRYWGAHGAPLHSLPASQHAFVAPNLAPKGWYDGMEAFVSRVLITAGEYECPRDDIVAFREDGLREYQDATMVLIREGVHADPVAEIVAAATGAGERGATEKSIVDWLHRGFK